MIDAARRNQIRDNVSTEMGWNPLDVQVIDRDVGTLRFIYYEKRVRFSRHRLTGGPQYAQRTGVILETRLEYMPGAHCDGGISPFEVQRVTRAVVKEFQSQVALQALARLG